MTRLCSTSPSRRAVARALLAVPLFAVVGGRSAPLGAQALEPTPECPDGDEPTPRQAEGPFYRPRTPHKTSFLNDGRPGEPIVLQGYVLSTACRAVPGALVDLWHADAEGAYDLQGFALRGHQFADARGRYRFETIVPGLYPGRTRHFHVKVQAPNNPVLTTQLYFPGEPANRLDRIFNEACLVKLGGNGARGEARYDFVLDLRT